MNTMKNDLTPNSQPPTSYAGFPCSVFREPFSENWYVDQRRTGWDAMFTFSGKERDAETGYGYFGARYYDSDLSIWLSVDPLASKYPSLSPYVYCANNPIKLVDPDGRDIIKVDKNGRTTITEQEGNDILKSIKTGKAQELSGNGVFRKALSEKKDGNGNVTETTLSGMSGSDAGDTYRFMADNTDVEWGRMESVNSEGGTDHTVGTSHDPLEESNISAMANDPKLAGTVLRYDHSHPCQGTHDVDGYKPSGADLDFWDSFIGKNPNAFAGINFNGGYSLYYKKGEKTDNYRANKATSQRPSTIK